MQQELSRTEMLLGEEKLKKLDQARVVLLGLGGVGGSCFETLVRGGIGHLTVVDNDVFTLSNLNRQVLSSYDSIGLYKVDMAEKRAKEINKYCTVKTYQEFISAENLEEIIPLNTSYVIDAIDTVTSKLQVISYCKTHAIPIISSMGTGNKLDPTKLTVGDIFTTTMCPLAKVMRKELRRRGVGYLKVVASTEKPLIPIVLAEKKEEGAVSLLQKRSAPGSTSFVPPAAGIILAGEVINDLIR
ncbi:MAG: tRNA threonylcarbamoyladenosine dehydratase [Clostridium sp.]|nr:tRNA threonylcarbamoyladenosine dehydratase [Clostridium sp.]